MAIRLLPDREYVRECLDYDPETGVFRWKERPPAHFSRPIVCARWNGKWAGKIAGKRMANGYSIIAINHSLWLAHRLAWLIERTDPFPDEIDHIDGNPGNNRIANLRTASRSDNEANGSRQRNNTIGIRGVRLHACGRFQPRIKHNGRELYLGLFPTLQEAVEVRRAAAERLFGKFARHG